jgi:hypothetical protein
MSDAIMGICPYCNLEKHLMRTYFYYDIECECHAGKHYVMVDHCEECAAKEPALTKVIVKTSKLRKRERPFKEHRSAIIKRK